MMPQDRPLLKRSQRPLTEGWIRLAGHRDRTSRLARGILLASGILCIPAIASARTESLRWTHPSPSGVTRFEALVRIGSGAFGSPISLGKPTADSQGVFNGSIQVADDADAVVALRAVDAAGLASAASNERTLLAPAPPPPPPVTGMPGGTEIPPNPSALARFDFDSGTAANWRDTDQFNSLSVNDALFTVTTVAGNPALQSTTTGTNMHSHFVGTPSTFENIVFTGRMGVDSTGGSLGVTAYSQYPTSDRYYRLRSMGNGAAFEIANHPDGTSACVGDVDTGVGLTAGAWYQFEMRVTSTGSNNRIQATVWRQGQAKPSTPQADCTDSAADRPRSGKVGVWSMGSGGRYWDDLELVGNAVTGTPPPAAPPAPPVLLGVEPVVP